MSATYASLAMPRLTIAIATSAIILATAGGVLLLRASSPVDGGPVLRVSQHEERFNPGTLALHVGDTVRVVNDDGQVHHHAYVDSPSFRFDSGDQAPGGHSDIRFTERGHFKVLCGIHPRMRLDVEVQ